MERQLALIAAEASEWRLDETTRRIGRQGVADARAALVAARRAAAEAAAERAADRHEAA